MGGLAEHQIRRAIEALVEGDPVVAEAVIEDDDGVDDLNYEVDIQATRLLALRQPIADDLRTVVAALKISSDLERIADYASNIAWRAIALADARSSKRDYAIPRMARFAQQMIDDILTAYVERDVDKAMAVWRLDSELDEMYTGLFRALLTYMMEDARNITSATHLLFIAKHIERIGDHVTNIAETIFFLVHGSRMRERRVRGKAETVITRIDKPVEI